jgi:hypothetical protein
MRYILQILGIYAYLAKQLPVSFYFAEVVFTLMLFASFDHKAVVTQYPVYGGMTDGQMEFAFEISCPHKRVTFPQLDYLSGNDGTCFVRTVMRYSRQIDKACEFFLPVSTQPLSHGSYRGGKTSGCWLDAVTDCVMNYSQSQIELAGLIFHTYNLLPIG